MNQVANPAQSGLVGVNDARLRLTVPSMQQAGRRVTFGSSPRKVKVSTICHPRLVALLVLLIVSEEFPLLQGAWIDWLRATSPVHSDSCGT
jgi:hypothetical protein